MLIELPLFQRIVLALVGICLFASTAIVAVNYGIGTFDDNYVVGASFERSAQGLRPTSDVKMRGVLVGSVKSIDMSPDGRARIDLRLDQGTAVPAQVRAVIEPLSIFGPKFINLVPLGDEINGPFLQGGELITDTATSAEVSDILSRTATLFADIDPEDIITLFTTTADAVAGLGPDLRKLVDNSTALVDMGNRLIPQTDQLLVNASSLSTELLGQLSQFQVAIDTANDLLPIVVANADPLGRTLDGVSRLAGAMGTYLETNADTFGQFAAKASEGLSVAIERIDEFPQVLQLVDGFFGGLGEIIRLPGPNGELIGALHGGLFQTLCGIIPIPLLCQVIG